MMKLNQWLSVVALAAVTFLVGSFFAPVARCDEPSLQDTVDWLMGKITKEAGYVCEVPWKDDAVKGKWTYKRSYSVVESDNGGLVVTETYIYIAHNNEPGFDDSTVNMTTTYDFLLKDFDPDKIEISDKGKLKEDGVTEFYQLTLHTRNDKPVIKCHYSVTSPNEPELKKDETSYTLSIVFTDKAIADRVAKAFAHAIRLSGGKATKEPF